MCICPKGFLTCAVTMWDDLQLQLDEVLQHLQLLRSRVSLWGKCACTVFGRDEGLPNSSGSTARLDSKSCARGVVVENCRFEFRFLPIPSFFVDVVFALGRYGSF